MKTTASTTTTSSRGFLRPHAPVPFRVFRSSRGPAEPLEPKTLLHEFRSHSWCVNRRGESLGGDLDLGVLILLVLLVPQAYQALVRSGDEPNTQPSGAGGGDGERAAQDNPGAEPPAANSGATGDGDEEPAGGRTPGAAETEEDPGQSATPDDEGDGAPQDEAGDEPRAETAAEPEDAVEVQPASAQAAAQEQYAAEAQYAAQQQQYAAEAQAEAPRRIPNSP